MSDILVKLAIGIGMKFLTETFLSKMLVMGLRTLADKTEKEVPEQIVDAVAQALGVIESGRVKKVS